jgi:translocation and assembly module TamA
VKPTLALLLIAWSLLLLPRPVSAAAVRVEIQGVSDELLSNVEAYLELKRRTGEELSEARLRLLFAEAEDDIRQALRPFGYYAPEIRSRLEPTEGGWVAHFEIAPGDAVRIDRMDIVIEGEGRGDSAFDALIEASGLSVGDPLRHDRYDRLKSQLAETARERGYLDARFIHSRLVVDPQKELARVDLSLDTGPRYRIGSIRVEQDFLRDKVVQRGVRFKEGEYLDAGKLRQSEFALYDMGYFSVVDIELVPDPQTHEVAVILRLSPTRKHRWTVGGGYSTDTNIYLRGGWENRLVNRRGHRMGVNLRLSEPKQDLLYRYVIPTGKPSEYLTIYTGFIRDQRGDTLSNRFEIAPVDVRFWGPWQRDVFGIFLAENSDLGDISFDDLFLIPGLRLVRTAWDDITRPTKGWKAALELRGSVTDLGAETDYLQFLARTASYVPIAKRSRLYLRGEVGLTEVDNFDVLPVSQRFFAGGDRSVRGYALNELSPVDEDGDKIGGRYLAFASIELEFDILKKWTLATFVDTGNAVDSLSDPMEHSAGVGFRWRSPIGLIGADVAQSLSDEDLGPRLHLSVRPEL